MSSTTEGGMAEQAKVGLEDAASAVQEKAGELKQQGRGKLSESLDQRTTAAGGQVRQAAEAMRQTGSHMRQPGSGSDQFGEVFESAAQRVERLGGYLERTSGERMLRDAEDFARRWPWAVAGMGLMVGFAASRFLKASSERRYEANPNRYGGRSPYSAPRGNGHGYGTAGHTYGTPGDTYGNASRTPGLGTDAGVT